MKVAVFLSGSGRTLDNILKAELHIDVSLVVSNKENVRGNEIAQRAGIKLEIVKSISSPLLAKLCKDVSLICLAGFLDYVPVPEEWRNRIMNIHPSLLPSFGGKGMYGHRVHERVITQGCKISGCTVHFVDDQYDHGPIILQRSVPVYDNDTADILADRVFEQECIAYPHAIRCFAENRLKVIYNRIVHCNLIANEQACQHTTNNDEQA